MANLGEFEFLLLAGVARLGAAAYGAAIRVEIEQVAGRRCSIGAIYVTLDRLEEKGWVKTWMGEPTAARGGRAKRMVALTPRGRAAVAEFYATVRRVSAGMVWDIAPAEML